MALSAADAPYSPLRAAVEVMAGSRLAILVNFIVNADGVLPINPAYLMISGFRECIFPNGI